MKVLLPLLVGLNILSVDVYYYDWSKCFDSTLESKICVLTSPSPNHFQDLLKAAKEKISTARLRVAKKIKAAAIIDMSSRDFVDSHLDVTTNIIKEMNECS